MVAVDCETPMKMAMDIAKGASPDSTGKEIVSLDIHATKSGVIE